LYVEPIVLVVTVGAFWFPSPTRDKWIWLLLLFIPILLLRLIAYGRAFTRTPLDAFFVAFFVLGLGNIYIANLGGGASPPYTRGLIMLARPALGVLIYYSVIEAAWQRGSMDRLMLITTWLGVLLGILALTATQWNEKIFQFEFIVTRLPTLKSLSLPLPKDAGLSFNANEIAGALAYFIPALAAMGAYRWRMKLSRIGVTLGFSLLFAALYLGQSRIAIIGVLFALGVVIYLLIPRGKWRNIAWAALAVVTIFELAIIFNPVSRDQLAERDESSLTGRVNIWRGAIEIIADYPVTGVGLNMFRDNRVRRLYPVPRYETRILPHAHNEILQLGADMGVPGMLVFIGIYVVANYMLVQTWRRGDPESRVVTVAFGAGLLAHFIFALADAIPLWDRLAFLYWYMLGLAGAQYAMLVQKRDFDPKSH
jgi:O-antigen ligase